MKTCFAIAATLLATAASCASIHACDNHNHEKHDHAEHKHACDSHDHANHKHAGHNHDHAEHKHEHKHACDSHDHANHNHAGHNHDHAEHKHKHEHADTACASIHACGNHDHAKHGHDHGGDGKSVEVAKEVQSVMGLTTAHPVKRKLQSSVSLTGRCELSPDARQTAAAPVAGRVTICVAPLARVKKGDVLFTVESPDLSASSREISVMKHRLAVYEKIGTANAQLASELAVKKAERAARIGTATEKDGIVTVCATVDAQVESFACTSGSWVETGASVIQLMQPECVRIKALVAASDATRLRDGMKATVGDVNGKVLIGVGGDDGLIPVFVTFPSGTTSFRSGARATALCVTDETADAVTCVPARAIVYIALQPTVFVRDEDDADRFIAMPVVPGISAGGLTAVAGLPDDPDLEVVVSGAYELKLALPAPGTSKSAGHFHADGTFHEGNNH